MSAAKNEKPIQKKVLLGMSETDIRALLPECPKYTASQIRAFLFNGADFSDMSSLKRELREHLNEEFIANPVVVEKTFKGKSGAVKYLFRLTDGNLIEGVFMPHGYGNTLCVSTQIGCRMGCRFCASGLDGLLRDLTAAEMLGQVVAVNAAEGGSVKERAVQKIVLMGSGEPFDNYDNVLKFLDLLGEDGFNLGERNISLSTSGLCDKIRKFADSGHKITLSISLHAPFDELRSELMPINKKFGVKEISSAARYYFEKTGRRVIFEYTLIAGKNDTPECAAALAEMTKGFPSHVNLIRLNEVKESGLRSPAADAVKVFEAELERLNGSCSVRRSLGADVEGACGQLRRRYIKHNKE